MSLIHPTVRSSFGFEILERNPAEVFSESQKNSIKKIYFLLCLPTGRFIYEQWIRLIQMRSHSVNKGQKSPSIELEVVNFEMPCTARSDSNIWTLKFYGQTDWDSQNHGDISIWIRFSMKKWYKKHLHESTNAYYFITDFSYQTGFLSHNILLSLLK